eukprot:jgi/Galph1/4085/GphlegSOOS_G2736.1
MVYSRFTEQDDETLLRLRDQEEQSWLEIAKRLNRNSSSCVSRYQMLKESEPVDLNFTPEEDRLLKELVTQGKSWKEIATILGKRYGHVCKRRYEDTLKNENKRGEFTEEEDKKLLSLVDKYGAKWNKIAEELKTRTAHQCLLRYERVLRPSLQRGPFNEKEDDRLLTLFDKYGPQWSKIEKEMPWRSSVQLRKRYCTLQEQKRRNKNAWAEEEEILLIQLFEKYGRKWTEISKELKTRTPSECMYRIYDYIEKGKLDRLIGWTEEYDKRLQEFVELYGEHWIYISRRMKYFSPRQCQQRITDG